MSATSIGMFHPVAGHRSASGTAVYVRETVRELAGVHPTYLYTGAGPLSTELERAAVEVIEIPRNRRWHQFRRAAGHLPFTIDRLSQQLSVSTASVVDAALDGTLGHIERHVDVLFTHHLGETILLSNALSTPVVCVMHGCKSVGLGTRSMTAFSDLAAIVANSEQTADEMAAKLGRRADGIVYPGVRADRFNPDRAPAFEDDGFAVLYVGRFYADKGIYDLLDAFAHLPERAHLYLVGRGEDERVRARLETLGVRGRVTVVGEVSHEDLPHYYTAADVVCLPSHYESFGLVNVEAMACGTPVVAGDVPGVRAYATDEETCLLVTPGDIDALADGLARLMDSSALRARLRAGGRAAARRFSWHDTALGFSRISERAT